MADPNTANKLLAMLNSGSGFGLPAGSASGNTPSPHGSRQPSASGHPVPARQPSGEATSAGPPASTLPHAQHPNTQSRSTSVSRSSSHTIPSPREPTPAPPGPSLQSVSLQDLFAGLGGGKSTPSPSRSTFGSGSVGGAPSVGGTGAKSLSNSREVSVDRAQEGTSGSIGVKSPPPHVTSPTGTAVANQADRLLGMLRAGGGPFSTPPSASSSSATTASPQSPSRRLQPQDSQNSQTQGQSKTNSPSQTRGQTQRERERTVSSGRLSSHLSTSVPPVPGASTGGPVDQTQAARGQNLLSLLKGAQSSLPPHPPHHGTSAPVVSHPSSRPQSIAPTPPSPAADQATADAPENPFSNAHEEQAAPAFDRPKANRQDDAQPVTKATAGEVEKADVIVKADSADDAKVASFFQASNDPSIGSRAIASSTTSSSTSTDVNKPAESKSIFDFVSPFDMFKSLNLGDAKKPASNASAVAEQQPPKQSSAPAVDGKTPTKPAPPTAQQPRPPPSASSAAPSESGSSKTTEVKVDSPYLVGKVVGKGKGKGPTSTTTHIRFDLSKPNLDSLISDHRESVQVVPITMVKAADVGYKRGRMMGMTGDYVAYGLSKGKLRLIDRSSGARIVLQLAGTATSGQIIDMAVSPTLVAVVGADQSVSVFRVPRTWYKDDPPVERVATILPSDKSEGKAFKVEWIRKASSGEHTLAIGSESGVILVDPTKDLDGKTFDQLTQSNKLLDTEGNLVDFCLNHTHQAIALISSSGFFDLFALSNRNRVIHRLLPASHANSAPSSIAFCEAHILIGRDRNTVYDLHQITSKHGIIASVTLDVPTNQASDNHYSHAVYDCANETLWIAPFARGSLLGLRYMLKDQQPVRIELPENQRDAPFGVIAEVPLEPVINMVLGPTNDDEEAASDIFFAHPAGYSIVTLGVEIMDLAEEAGGTVAVPNETSTMPDQGRTADAGAVKIKTVVESVQQTGDTKAEPNVSGPKSIDRDAPAVNAIPSVPEPGASDMSRKDSKSVAKGTPTKAAPATKDREIKEDQGVSAKELKKTEDRIVTQTRQALSSQIDKVNQRLDGISADKIGADIGTKLDKSLRAAVGTTVRDEIKKSLIPAIQNELRLGLPRAVGEVLPSELERVMVPLLQRQIPSVVQNSVERAVRHAIGSLVLPAITQATDQAFDGMAQELKSEILQARKDLSPLPQSDHAADFASMATAISELQRQVTDLSEQLQQAQASSLRTPQAQVPRPIPVAPRIQLPNAQDLEDAFLNALSRQTIEATVRLVAEYDGMIDYCLPPPPRQGPLSQAVLLTLLHRLALVLFDPTIMPMGETHEIFARCLAWESRVVHVINRTPETETYFVRVIAIVGGALGEVVKKLEGGQMMHAAMQVRDMIEAVHDKVEVR